MAVIGLNTNTTKPVYPGKSECQCIDQTSTLSSLADRSCKLPNGENGVILTLGRCGSFSYGSSECLQHDLLNDPACQMEEIGKSIIPAYCFRPWCYVDKASCSASDEVVYRSSYFPYGSGADLFYSYTTCNATSDDWFASVKNEVLGAISLDVAVAYYIAPMHYKRDPISDTILTEPGDEYYDNAIAFEGVYISYANRLKTISDGDIQKLSFTHRSGGSSKMHPTSAFTAAVQDVANGLVDMAVGPFWITGERLKMTAFTIPIVTDKTYLVIKRPTERLNDQLVKVLAPFTGELWGLIIGIICVAALLSVWFTDKHIKKTTSDRRKKFYQQKNPTKRRKSAYLRLALDSFLSMGSHFVSAGVDTDPGATLPQKFLMFGFGFFILITVSAYVANLAAFLTMSLAESASTIEDAVAAGYKICAHPAAKKQIVDAWPNGDFYFSLKGSDFRGMLEDYDEGKCKVLVIGYEDTHMDLGFIRAMCKRDLVYTDSVIAEIPMGFPIRPELASGFSYWIHAGWKSHDLTLAKVKEDFDNELYGDCNVKLESGATESSEHAQIGIQNMFFPLLFFGASAFIAVSLQLIYVYQLKKGGEGSLVGRVSTMEMMATKKSRQPIAFSRMSKTARTDRKQSIVDKSEASPADPLRRRVMSFNHEEEKLEELEEVEHDDEEFYDHAI